MLRCILSYRRCERKHWATFTLHLTIQTALIVAVSELLHSVKNFSKQKGPFDCSLTLGYTYAVLTLFTTFLFLIWLIILLSMLPFTDPNCPRSDSLTDSFSGCCGFTLWRHRTRISCSPRLGSSAELCCMICFCSDLSDEIGSAKDISSVFNLSVF